MIGRFLSVAIGALLLPASYSLVSRPETPASGSRKQGAAEAAPAPAARAFYSTSLGTTKQVVVYLPPSYASRPGRRYPVLYYLHGMWGGEWDWTRQGMLAQAMDSLARRGLPEAIVVMPDGDDSYYTTWNVLAASSGCPSRVPKTEPAAAYCVPWSRYDDYVAHDLVAWVDSTYRTLPGRAHRGIGGLSMGGYGAVTLALRYPEVFGAAASHSGVLAPRLGLKGRAPIAAEAALAASWGPTFWPYLRPVFGRDSAGWVARDPAHLVARLQARDAARPAAPVPALFLDVGRDDDFLAQNRAFRDALARSGVKYRYAEWPGRHNWAYWRGHVGESLAWLLGRVK